MNIVLHEIKKLFSLRMLLILAMFCALMFAWSMLWVLDGYIIPHRSAERGHFAEKLADRYGHRVTDDEIEEYVAETLPPLLEEAEEHIARLPIFAEAGIYSYHDYRVMRFLREPTQLQDEASYALAFEESDYIEMTIQDLCQVWEHWDGRGNMHEHERRISRDLREWSEVFYQEVLDAEQNGSLAEYIAEQRAILEAEADAHIAGSPEFSAQRITSYAEFLEYWDMEMYDLYDERVQLRLWRSLFNAEYDHVADKLLNRVEAIEYHVLELQPFDRLGMIEQLMERDLGSLPTDFEYNRLMEIIETEEYKNIMSAAVYSNSWRYFERLARMIAYVVLILVSPLIAYDRSRNMQSIQYTAKLGRRLMYRQLAAVLISTFVSAILLTALFFGIFFFISGQLKWWDHSVVSFMNWAIPLFPLTLGQLIMVMMAMSVVLSLAVACIAFILSRYSRNLVMVLFKAVPLYIALGFLYNPIFGTYDTVAPLMLYNPLYRLTSIPGTELIFCALLLVLSLAAALWVSRRERHVDVV